jgi:hypothetical protein
MIKSPSILDDPSYESFHAFVSLAGRNAPTTQGIAARQIKLSIETHIDALNVEQREGLLAFIEAYIRQIRK